MKDIVIGLLSDCISYASNGVVMTGAAGATASTAISRIMQKRHDILREVIRSEIRQGNFEDIDQDELTGVFFRLIRDAQEGVAKNNLRLMAKVINGMAEKKELKAPSFLRYANVLASLTEDEIIVLGIMAGLNWGTFIGDRGKEKFIAAGIDHYESVQQALLRTGLVMMRVDSQLGNENIYRKKVDSSAVYILTPLMTEIEKYMNFKVASEAA